MCARAATADTIASPGSRFVVPFGLWTCDLRASASVRRIAELEAGAGDVLFIPPGHRVWVLGDEPCVLIDW